MQNKTSIRVSHRWVRRNTGLPCAMVLTVSSGLSPVTGLFCHRRWLRCASIIANLTPASGRQDHTASPSAIVSFVRASFKIAPDATASTASRSYVRDDRETPLMSGRDDMRYKCDLGCTETGIFFARGMDRKCGETPDGQISLRRVGKYRFNVFACNKREAFVQGSQRVARMRAR